MIHFVLACACGLSFRFPSRWCWLSAAAKTSHALLRRGSRPSPRAAERTTTQKKQLSPLTRLLSRSPSIARPNPADRDLDLEIRFLIFATELGRTIHVEIRRVNDACVADGVIARFDRPGEQLTYIGLTHSERRAGQALVVDLDDAERADPDADFDERHATRPAQLAVHAYDTGRPIFSAPLGAGERVANGRSEGDVWYPVVGLDSDGNQAGGFTWTGQTLKRVAPPD